jgi:hypothetical protein
MRHIGNGHRDRTHGADEWQRNHGLYKPGSYMGHRHHRSRQLHGRSLARFDYNHEYREQHSDDREPILREVEQLTMKNILLIAALLLARTVSASCTVPTISSPTVGSITTTGATITWTTNTIANSLIVWGPNNPGTSSGLQDTAGVTSHSYTISGLIPATTYGWGIVSEAIDTSLGTPCGNGYVIYYNGAAGTTFNTASPSAGTFAYGVFSTYSPSYATQGYGIYIVVRLQATVGTYTAHSLTVTLTGFPASCFCQVFWPNAESTQPYGLGNLDADTISTTTVPGDTLNVYTFNQKEFFVLTNVGGTTPTGSYTLTATAACTTGGCGIPTETATFPLVVVSSSAPFSGTAMTFSTPTLTGVGYPAIPQLSTYLASANTYGIQNCAQDNDTGTRTIRANDQSNLTPVGPSTTYGAWFYGDNLFSAIRSLLNNGSNWEQCITNIKQVYRNNYAIGTTIQTFMTFSTGYFQDYQTAAEPADLTLINKYNTSDNYAPPHGIMVDVSYLQREAAYSMRNQMHGLLLGQTAGGYLSMTAPNYREYTKEHILGHLDQICLTQNAQYWENFMIGLEADSLIQYYQLVSKDPRIPPAIKCVADYLWSNQWQALETGDFPYDKWQWIGNLSNANVIGGNCQVVLDNLIAPMYAWLFTLTGSSTYQTEGDAIFGYGVQLGQGGVSCGGGISPNLTWPSGNNGKQFAQQYHLGAQYVTWRSQPPVSTVPASGVSF